MPHLDYTDGDIRYHGRFFAATEHPCRTEDDIAGSDAELGYACMAGSNCPADEQPAKQRRLQEELRQQDAVLFCAEIRATNEGGTPQYAWFKAPYQPRLLGRFDGTSGLFIRPDGQAAYAFRCNGRPAPMSEMAVLLPPGGSVCFEVILSHDFMDRDRMARLAADFDFDERFGQMRQFWKRLIDAYGQLEIPEKPLQDIVRANIPNLEVACIGAAGRMVAPTVGEYGPIGSESLALIKWFLSCGRFELARRCLEFFLWWQRDDGFIQTFTGYGLLPQYFDRFLSIPIRIKKFLKIQLIHPSNRNTPDRNGRCVRQSNTQQRSASDICEPILLFQKLQQREQMRILLYLIQKYQRILPPSHQLSCDHG